MADEKNSKEFVSSENSDEDSYFTDHTFYSDNSFINAENSNENLNGFSNNNSETFNGTTQLSNKIVQDNDSKEDAMKKISPIEVSPQDNNKRSKSEIPSTIYEDPDENFDSDETLSPIDGETKLSDSSILQDQNANDCVIQIEEEAFSESLSEQKHYEDEQEHQNSLHDIVGIKHPVVLAISSSSGNLADVEDNLESSISFIKNSNTFVENIIYLPISSKAELADKEAQKPSDSEQEGHTSVDWLDNTQSSDSSINQQSEKSPNMNKRKVRSDVSRNKKRKCHVCNKKLDLTAITCRCGGLFCAKHRYDREHNCTFDYKAMGAEKIRKENPKIIAEKITKL